MNGANTLIEIETSDANTRMKMSDVNSWICSSVPDWRIPFVKRQFIYFFRHESRVNELKEQISLLKAAKDRVEMEVDATTRNREEVYEHVRTWLGRAHEVSRDEKGEELERARERARARCFLGLGPNLRSRRKLCKKAIAEAEDVAELLRDYKKFIALVPDRPALTEVALNEDVENFKSRANTFEGIMKALKDPSVSRIGVYGMGGVGKTTLVKQIQRKAREENIFDEIAWATVTSEPNIKRIQEEIADALGLKFKAETVATRATELIHRLNNGQRILIVLDDIWEEELSLPDIGISFKDCQIVDGNKMLTEGRCKILMTSRNEDVLRAMKSTSAINFEVTLLPFPEAESLFTEIVDVPRGDNYKSIATEVIEKCAGSPIAIAAVAKALLRTASMAVWEDVRNKLKRSMANTSMEGVQQHVYATLKLGYEMLKDKEAQQLFLLLGMFEQGASIGADVLLRYGVGLDLFDGVGTYHEARSRVNALLHELRASSLLLKGDYNDTVKLHDLVRDVAANIANSDPYNMFRIEGKSDDFKRLSKNGKLSHATGLFILPGSELPGVLECPKLEFLHIFGEEESFIYDRLFEQTKELKVLDLTRTKELKSLPASLLSLTSLKSLCVDGCRGIRNVSNIGKLQHLLVLSIRDSYIEELPEDLKQLRELQLLDLSNCSKLKVIPENLFSSLTKLEELYMRKSFNRWGVEGNASVSELLYLSSLTVLHIHIPQAKMIPEDMPFGKLTSYKIVIGDTDWHSNWDCEYEKSRKLIISNPGVSILNAKKLLANTEELRLVRLEGVRNVLYELDSDGFLHLKNLCVEFSSLQYLVNFEGNRFSNAEAFPDLESLIIINSNDLEMVCHGQPKAEALMGLRSICILRCGILKRLFPLSMAKYLLQLEKIEVRSCKNLITIFDMGMVDSNEASETTGGMELSKLRSLTLENLPKFVGFCTQDQQMQPLFNERILCPHTLDTMPSRMSHGLVNLTSLTIDRCGRLKYLFSSSVVRSLEQLQWLEVSDCKSMEMIVLGKETNPGSEFGAELLFPQLKFLKLEHIENLRGFCSKNYDVNFPSLETVVLLECHQLEAVFSTHEITLQPHLIDKILLPHTLETMPSRTSYGLVNLTRLTIDRCGHLKYLFSFSVARSLEQLQWLKVSDCMSMEMIVLGEETNPGNEFGAKLSFPQLKFLDLQRMENLRGFCSKNFDVNFPSLETVVVLECHQLEASFSTHEITLQPHLIDKIDEEEHLESSEITDQPQGAIPNVFSRVSYEWQKLGRLRDLLLSVSSYPCAVVDKTKLQWWTNKALQITRRITQEHARTSNLILSRWQLGEAAEGGSYFHNNALRSAAHNHLHHPFLMEIHRVLPKAMLQKVYHHDAADRTHSSCSGKLPVPADILELAVNLAVRHILCSLCNGDITRIRISGRCKERIVKAIQHHPALPSEFQHVLRFSGSSIKSMIKVRKVNELQTTTHLQGSIPYYSSKGLLKPMLLVEDADEENAAGSLEIPLDPPLNMNMMNTISGAAMVFTAELTADMEIRMEDHLLSWHLFCENVGDIMLSPDFQQLAVSIVTKCDGHLLAVILIARFLKNVSDICLWELALQRLNMQLTFGVEGISVVMINALLLIWEQLDDSKRQCLRHHALNFNGEEDHRPDIIVAYWVDHRLVLTPEQGNCVLQDLLDAFLLQTVGSEIVVMHEQTQKIIVELLRDRDTLLLSQCGLGPTEPPEEEKWNVREIHLTDNNISELPESPNCPDLILLNLQKNYDLTTIPSRFFEQMPVLQILDLSYTNVKSFPESLPRLVSLRELFLRGCELIMELPTEVGQLQNLEKLDLDETQIIELPETIGNLTKLKFLRVSFYGYENQSKKELQRETIIRPGTISNLLELTELSIDVDPDDERWEAAAKTIIEEACGLERLTHLRLYLPNLETLWNRSMGGTSLVQYPLSHFRFTVGHHKDRLISRVPHEVERRFEAWEKCFKFINGEDISAMVKRSLKEVVSFFLDSHASAQSLSEFGIENIMQLKFCLLAECHQIQTIIDGKDVTENLDRDRFLPSAEEPALPYLQYLTVYYMKNLESIWRGPTQKHCLSNLRLLALHRCPKLSIIFSPDLIASMQKLEELVIEDCPEVTSLVISRDEGTPSYASVSSIAEYLLPSLKRMSLLFLPKLDRMSNGLLIAPRLEKVGIYYCRQLRNISTIETSSQELNVKGEVTWWNALEWENQQLRSRIKFKEIERKRDLISQLVDDKFIVLAYKQEC